MSSTHLGAAGWGCILAPHCHGEGGEELGDVHVGLPQPFTEHAGHGLQHVEAQHFPINPINPMSPTYPIYPEPPIAAKPKAMSTQQAPTPHFTSNKSKIAG